MSADRFRDFDGRFLCCRKLTVNWWFMNER